MKLTFFELAADSKKELGEEMISVFRSSKCGWRCGRALVGLVDVRIQNIRTLKT